MPEDVKIDLFTEEEGAALFELMKGADIVLEPVVDVSSLSFSTQGILDPIGQLASWLADQLQAIASWIASAVTTAFTQIVNSIIKPILDIISSTVSSISSLSTSIWNTVKAIPSQLSSIASSISTSITSLYNTIVSGLNSVISNLSSVFSQLVSWLREIITAISKSVEAIISAIASRIEAAFTVITRSLAALESNISSWIRGVLTDLWKAVEAIGSTLASNIAGVLKALSDFASSTSALLKELFDGLARGVSALSSQITQVGDSLIKSFTSLVATIEGWFKDVVNNIVKGVDYIVSQITQAGESFLKLLTSISTAIEGWIKEVINNIMKGVEALASKITQVGDSFLISLSAIVTTIEGWLKEIISSLSKGVDALASQITQMGDSLIKSFTSFIATIEGWLKEAVSKILDGLGALGATVASSFEEARKALISLSESISQTFKDIAAALAGLKTFIAEQATQGVETIWNYVKDIASSIWSGIASGFENLAKTFSALWAWLDAGLGSLARSLAEFAAYVERLGAMIMGGISQVNSFIMNIPSFLQEAFKPVVDFFLIFAGFPDNPVDWVKTYFLTPIAAGLKYIAEQIAAGFTWFTEKIREGLPVLGGQLVELGKAISEGLTTLWTWLYEGVKSIANIIKTVFESIYKWFLDALSTSANAIKSALGLFEPSVSSIFGELHIHSPPYLTPANVILAMTQGTLWSTVLFAVTVLMQVPVRALAFGLRTFGLSVSNLLSDVELHLKFWGAGAVARFSLGKALGSAIFTTGDELTKVIEKWLDYSALGMLFWYGQAVSRLVTYHLRNHIPIEIPTIAEIIRALRRSYVADVLPQIVGKSFSDLYDGMKYYLAVRGYADFFTALIIAREDEFHLTITDRFLTTRKIPLSLRFTLPTPSEVVRWLIRDVVIPPVVKKEEFEKNVEKLLGMAGYPLDVAKLYYIANFRYPSPTALARFYWRGVTKVLWLPDSLEEKEIADAVGAKYAAVSPRELNKNVAVINEAMSRYWRWHDYAPFAWFPGFTTDKAIMFELTAALPRRIDLRWIMRWGIFEHIAALMKTVGLPPDAPMPDILSRIPAASGRELLSTKVTPEIAADVRLLARLLQSTGFHPDFVSILAVAQAHQVIADEMTLTRTGFLSAYKEGLITLDSAELLMSGLFIVKFSTGYMEPATGEWRDVTYNKPVLWLPAERRLLQIRSVFDRYIDLWRDFMREVVAGVRRIAIYPDEAAKFMRNYFAKISVSWSRDIKALSGSDWAPVLDEDYMGLWLEYSTLTRVIETRIWIRHYTARLMGWLMYRVSYGWLTEEDYEQLISIFEQNKWLTAEESNFFRQAFTWLAGIVRREYIPSPSTLATLAEYMVIPEKVVTLVFDKLRVPDEFRPLYAEYIRIRPLKTDFKSLISTARRAHRLGVISDVDLKKILEEAVKFGFSEIELSLIERIVELEEAMEKSKEYVPSLSSLVTFSEYIGIPEEIVDSVLNAKRVREPWRSLWKQLIKARTIADDVRVLLTSYYRAIRSGAVIPDDLRRAVENYFRAAGLTADELAIRDMAVQLDLLIESLPSLSALAMLAEYVDIPDEYVSKILVQRRVEKTYAGLWLQYIQRRSIAGEVERVVSAFTRLYERFSIPDDVVKKVEELMAQGGWTTRELSIWKFELAIRRDYRALTTVIPSLREIVYDGMYIVNYEAVIEDLFRTYGLTIEKYKAQLDYYKKLVKSRRLWRHFSWWRSRLMNAYAYGLLTMDQVKEKLEKLKNIGLIDSDEIVFILDGLELQRMYTQRPRTR